MPKKLIFCFLFILVITNVYSRGMWEKSRLNRWEKETRVGKYLTSYENWRDIEIFARQEGEVIVYANTSRIYDFVLPFYKKYSIKPYLYHMATEDIFEKMQFDQNLGLNNVDLILTSDSAQSNNLLALGRVYSYTPSSVKKKLEKTAAGEDLPVQRFSAHLVLYNNEINKKGSPLSSWWDLTKEEYRGKVTFKDPLKSANLMYLLSTMVYNSDDLELAYEEAFGEPFHNINISRNSNAGLEFLKRLLTNDPIITLEEETSAKLTGRRNQKEAPIAIVSSSVLGLRNDKNLAFDVDWDLKPFGGILIKNVMVIPVLAPNPNASKLLVKWLFGITERSGYENLKVAGEWSVIKNTDKMPGQPFLKDLNFWAIDDEWMYENIRSIQNFTQEYIENYYYEEE